MVFMASPQEDECGNAVRTLKGIETARLGPWSDRCMSPVETQSEP